jgi:hypothetical protein
MALSTDTGVPETLRQAVKMQLGVAFHPPFEIPIAVAVNGALMSSLWFFLPAHWKNALFTFHGTLAYAMVLAGWMISDVPATNVLGPDAPRMVAALEDPAAFRRLLYAKNIVLWLLVAPICSLVAVGIGINNHDLTVMIVSVVAIAILPFGALGLSAWVGIRFPYHPIPVKYRWEHRRPFRHMIIRWFSLAVTPYMLVPVVVLVLFLPSLAYWAADAPNGLHSRLSAGQYAIGILIACVIAVGGSLGGHHVGERLAHRRKEELSAYLSDPTRG